MRRLALTTIIASLALAPAASAQDEAAARALQAGGDRVELSNGRGFATFRSRSGAILGSIRRGRVLITDIRRDSDVSVSGCERTRTVKRTTICIGRDLTFSVERGAWNARLRGRGISVSAVLRGSLTLAGTAGTITVRDGEERSWPREVRTIRLG